MGAAAIASELLQAHTIGSRTVCDIQTFVALNVDQIVTAARGLDGPFLFTPTAIVPLDHRGKIGQVAWVAPTDAQDSTGMDGPEFVESATGRFDLPFLIVCV